jgi:hypothetical protein
MMTARISPPLAEFREKQFTERDFFPHRSALIRKQYPDTYLQMEQRGMTPQELLACSFRQLNLYSDHLSGFPPELFTDSTVNWHHQQLGEKGFIAAAGLCIQDSSLLVTLLQSDLCQQLFRHAALKAACRSQVENRFHAWYKFLFNAILDYAMQSGIEAVYSPTAESIVQWIKKPVNPVLFRRVYDFPGVFYQARAVTRNRTDYWEVPIAANAQRVVRLSRTVPVEEPTGKLICIFHDTEENLGENVSVEECRRSLTSMLKIESALGVRATYNLVGSLFASKKDEIRAAGPHSLAFHSYDHVPENDRQLARCRQVDLQVHGYRAPRSEITPELSDYALSYYNFEWLASGLRSLLRDCPDIEWRRTPSGLRSLGVNGCGLRNGIVKIPVLTDDHLLFTAQMDYPEWRCRLLESAAEGPILTFGLHDCYARFWLDSYPELLETLGGMGRFVTADELCDLTFRKSAADINPPQTHPTTPETSIPPTRHA